MENENITRRLAAILAADVAGYTRLMESDEDATIAAWRSARSGVIDPAIDQYHGRIVKHTGDGFLAEFSTVLDAVNCAVTMQKQMADITADQPADTRLQFRMGINLGDIVVDADDIHGDGVNIAARLESLAEPGGVCVSADVYNQVHKRVDLEFEDLGEKKVKNIAEPVLAFHIRPGGPTGGPTGVRTRRRRQIDGRVWIGAVAAIAIVALAGGYWWLRPADSGIAQASIDRMAFPLPEKPSIAVLPFTNLSDDKSQSMIADGLSEDLITALSQVSSLFVIARNTVFSYKGKSVNVQQVAEELGVRYVLEGSIQKSGDKIRITAQLIDALGGHHLWAERYDRSVNDLFKLQDEITNQIVTALRVRLTEGEETRVHRAHTRDMKAWNLYNEGLEHFYHFSKTGNAEARKLFEEAIETDRAYALAYALVAWTHWLDAINRWVDRPDLALEQASFLAEKAAGLDDTLPDVYALRGALKLNSGEFDESIALARKAVSLNPNHASNNAILGMILQISGKPEEGIRQFKAAMRLSPYYPAWYLENLGYAYLMKGDYKDATTAFTEFLRRGPRPERTAHAHVARAQALASLGQDDAAKEDIARALEIIPTLTASEYVSRSLTKNREWLDKGLAQLVRVGMPK